MCTRTVHTDVMGKIRRDESLYCWKCMTGPGKTEWSRNCTEKYRKNLYILKNQMSILIQRIRTPYGNVLI